MNNLHDLGSGIAGTALYDAVLARHGDMWEAAHTSVKALASQPVDTHPVTANLYQGLPAVAYVLQTAGHNGYASTLDALDRKIDILVEQRLEAAYARMASQRPPRMREFDLISGLTGVGAYLLHRRRADTLTNVATYLARLLTEPVIVDGQPVPGWWAHDSPSGRYDDGWPLGHANFGIAHGVAGPIALLALCARSGIVQLPELQEALAEGCAVLSRWARPLDGGGTGWPETLDLQAFLRGPRSGEAPGRPSWCYGTPGIARALQLAAAACENPPARQLAERALISCITDDGQLALLEDATVCHGWSGLLLTADRIAADASHDAIAHKIPALRERLIAHTVRHGIPDGPGLLTGAAGTLLTLHTLAPTRPVDPVWETCLLLN
ncbi:lanthionine synthetase C family protein [Streptomyces cavernicola]|uniref:Lanthionine synthetase C family protein n=1 Tax=Streptomyces cavernicola TaxID=3043613 RepID=A0ABT6SPT7_9ACTN|nr:lanthionine synthetase C family protein [Streptomyces sp. B-S-A6]MDI3409448.1 lanthionine synthetase C family protein [Streptomyces sp. B-S-A6]